MKFKFVEHGTQSADQVKRVFYDDRNEYGFIVTSPDLTIQEPVAELRIFDDVSLTVGVETGTIYRANGLTSKNEWLRSDLRELVAQGGIVSVDTTELSKDSGIGYDTNIVNNQILYDEANKLLLAGSVSDRTKIVKVFENLALGLEGESLVAVYMWNM